MVVSILWRFTFSERKQTVCSLSLQNTLHVIKPQTVSLVELQLYWMFYIGFYVYFTVIVLRV